MKILVTGGAGYIGSFMTKRLLDNGYEVTVIDSLERGYIDVIDKRATFEQGDLKNLEFVERVFRKGSFNAVLHFAGYISVEESMNKPDLYYRNNVNGSRNLISSGVNIGKIDKFIFSSTAAVYGSPIRVPIVENHPKNPNNPYGQSKLEVEKILESFQKHSKLNFVSLRYFNAAGAALDGSMGEDHEPETHIIPLAIKAAIEEGEFSLYGTNYNTPDGTCIRDYIHVIDLVQAHILALDRLEREKGRFFYNVGTGRGYSNKEVVERVKSVAGIDFKVVVKDRRQGDPPVLVADAGKIRKELGFRPKYSDMETIVKTAFKWHERNSELRI